MHAYLMHSVCMMVSALLFAGWLQAQTHCCKMQMARPRCTKPQRKGTLLLCLCCSLLGVAPVCCVTSEA